MSNRIAKKRVLNMKKYIPSTDWKYFKYLNLKKVFLSGKRVETGYIFKLVENQYRYF